MLSRTLILKVSGLSFMEKLVRRSFLFKGMVRRFIGGDTLEEGLENSRPLLDRGFLISLDLLGENVHTNEESESAKAAFIAMIRTLAQNPGFKPYRLAENGTRYDAIESINISIKLTQCGLDISDAFAEANYRETLDAARDVGTFVRVDMEASEYTERTVAMMERVVPSYPNAGTVLQSYLKRTNDDLDRVIALDARCRLVKGAYLEPATVAYVDKADVDRRYIELAKRMLVEGNYPAFATHDGAIIDEIKRFAAEKGIDPKSFEFQMLFGIRRDLQNKLLDEGYRVRVYVPFGDSWYPYFTRRLAERPANLFFILKSMFKG